MLASGGGGGGGGVYSYSADTIEVEMVLQRGLVNQIAPLQAPLPGPEQSPVGPNERKAHPPKAKGPGAPA